MPRGGRCLPEVLHQRPLCEASPKSWCRDIFSFAFDDVGQVRAFAAGGESSEKLQGAPNGMQGLRVDSSEYCQHEVSSWQLPSGHLLIVETNALQRCSTSD